MIDLHCHILPGIDDGPRTIADSVALAHAAHNDGTRTIVATPHVSFNWPDNDAERIADGVLAVRAALHDAGIQIELLAGAEVALTRAADLQPAELAALRLGGGPWLLVECPFGPAHGFEQGLGVLRMQGHRILLAHPERCPDLQRDPERLAELVSLGARTSVTAGSFTGLYGRVVRRCAWDLLRRGLVHSVASDGHDHVRRPPTLKGALQTAGLSDDADHLALAAPAAILRGDDVPMRPLPPDNLPARLLRRARRLAPSPR